MRVGRTSARARKGGSEIDFAIALGIGGWLVLIVGALVFGVVAQFVGETRTGYEWLVDAIGAGIGALVASEFIVGWRTFEPMWDGLAIVPALIGGLVLGIVVEVVTRYLSEAPTPVARPRRDRRDETCRRRPTGLARSRSQDLGASEEDH